MTPHFGRAARLMLGASLVFAGLAGNPAAHAAKPNPREPNLVVTEGAFAQQFGGHVTTRHPVQFTWRHTTENHGKKKSPVTHTGLEFVTMDGKERILDQVRVPPLAKDEAAKGGHTFTENIDTRYGYGTYLPRICADPKEKLTEESHKGNNCKKFRHEYYVAPFAVNGTVSGNVELFPGVTLRWNGNVSGQLTDGLDSAEGGVVDYTFVSGAVSYTVAGIDNRGCSWLGTGTYQPSTWRAKFTMVFGIGAHYTSHAGIAPLWNFPATVICPDGHATSATVQPAMLGVGNWLDTVNEAPSFKDPGVTQMKGTATDQRPTGHTTWNWDLTASDFGT